MVLLHEEDNPIEDKRKTRQRERESILIRTHIPPVSLLQWFLRALGILKYYVLCSNALIVCTLSVKHSNRAVTPSLVIWMFGIIFWYCCSASLLLPLSNSTAVLFNHKHAAKNAVFWKLWWKPPLLWATAVGPRRRRHCPWNNVAQNSASVSHMMMGSIG